MLERCFTAPALSVNECAHRGTLLNSSNSARKWTQLIQHRLIEGAE
jgi:hypothetical protein